MKKKNKKNRERVISRLKSNTRQTAVKIQESIPEKRSSTLMKILKAPNSIKIIFIFIICVVVFFLNIPRGDMLIVKDIRVSSGVHIAKETIENKLSGRINSMIGKKINTSNAKKDIIRIDTSQHPLYGSLVYMDRKVTDNSDGTVGAIEQLIRRILGKEDHYVTIVVEPMELNLKDTVVKVYLSVTNRDGASINSRMASIPLIVRDEESEIIDACARLVCEQYHPMAAVFEDYLKDYMLIKQEVDYSNPSNWNQDNFSRDTAIINDYLSKIDNDDFETRLSLDYLRAYIFQQWGVSNSDTVFQQKALAEYMDLSGKEDNQVNKEIILNRINEISSDIALISEEKDFDNKDPERILSKYRTHLRDSKQVIITYNDRFSDKYGMMYTYEQRNGGWEQVDVANNIEVNFGKKGIAKPREKYEGDNKAPSGLFPITRYFVKGNNYPAKLNQIKVSGKMGWDCDTNSPFYNTPRIFKNGVKRPSDALSRGDILYDYVIVIDYNMESIPGKGSAIFLHCSLPKLPTAGCLSIDKKEMIKLLDWLDIDMHPVIIIESLENVK